MPGNSEIEHIWKHSLYRGGGRVLEDTTGFLKGCVCVYCAQLYLIHCDPMECSLLGSSVHGIFQARILEWVAIPFSRGCSQPRVECTFPVLEGGFFTTEPLGKSLPKGSEGFPNSSAGKESACNAGDVS